METQETGDEQLDPWALPEFERTGPNWNGR